MKIDWNLWIRRVKGCKSAAQSTRFPPRRPGLKMKGWLIAQFEKGIEYLLLQKAAMSSAVSCPVRPVSSTNTFEGLLLQPAKSKLNSWIGLAGVCRIWCLRACMAFAIIDKDLHNVHRRCVLRGATGDPRSLHASTRAVTVATRV